MTGVTSPAAPMLRPSRTMTEERLPQIERTPLLPPPQSHPKWCTEEKESLLPEGLLQVQARQLQSRRLTLEPALSRGHSEYVHRVKGKGNPCTTAAPGGDDKAACSDGEFHDNEKQSHNNGRKSTRGPQQF